jgi:hypothetical protein
MSQADAFSVDYFAARERFRAAVERTGGQLESHAIAARGPAGEDLTIDAATFGEGEHPGRTLIVSSGVHGVEGFFGSAVQLAALGQEELLASLPGGARLVMLHALNPHGFAHLRRWNEDNVDLNRNLLREGEPFAGSPPLYERLDAWLNPKSPPRRFEPFTLQAALALARYGRRALAETLPVGQHEFPQGLFFAGKGPVESNRLIAANMDRWIGPAEVVVHIDFHTGLGRHGTYELYLPDALGSPVDEWFARHFGREVVSATPGGDAAGADNEPSGYPTRGSWDKWCVDRYRQRDYRFACAEFGTYGNIAVVKALRNENRAHYWGRGRLEAAKRQLVEAFAPASARWRETVVAKGVAIVRQAMHALQRIE